MQRKLFFMLSIVIALLILFPFHVLADGTEILGQPIDIEIASGTGIVAGGTGLVLAQPGTIALDIPLGVTVKQVLLYWTGTGPLNPPVVPDDTIIVNSVEVTGIFIGGGITSANGFVFRADITDLDLVSPGFQSLSLEGLTFPVNSGAGILVIIDDGTGASNLDIRDGHDFAFAPLNPPLDTTFPQTFTFAPSISDRMATLNMFFANVRGTASGGGFRPSAVEIIISETTFVFDNLLDSNDGEEWDTVIIDVNIPAGVTNLTVQALSQDNDPPTTGPNGEAEGNVASFSWLAAGLSVSPPPDPCIDIIKYTNGADANNPDGIDVPFILMGDTVNWMYEVTNCGGVPFAMDEVTVTDNIPDVNPMFDSEVSGNGDDVLDPGEVWRYRATGTAVNLELPQPDLIIVTDVCTRGEASIPPSNAYTNIGTVTVPGASDDDPSSYCNKRPGIDIIKFTNGFDANDPDGTDVPQIPVGETVTWTYKVTNTGNMSFVMADVVVTDNIPGVMPMFDSEITGNGDNVLDPGEVWLYKATGTAVNLELPQPDLMIVSDVCTRGDASIPPSNAYTNIGTVTVPGASDDDPSSYCNKKPGINIIKYTNGADANDPDGADVPQIPLGDTVTWTYKVTNTGNISFMMADVIVTDNIPGVMPMFDSEVSGNGDNVLDPGEVWLYKATGTAVNLELPPPEVIVVSDVCTRGSTISPPRNAYTNIGTVTVPGDSDDDPSSYCNPPRAACRVTAGGNKDGITTPCTTLDNGLTLLDDTCSNDSNGDKKDPISNTWGGQAGAQPAIDCNWSHHYKSPDGNFGFHVQDCFYIECSDPGPDCVPSADGKPETRQIDFSGKGRFTHMSGIFESFPDKNNEVCFMIHLEDIGEPGRGGRWPSATDPCTHCPGTEVQNGLPEEDCKNCTDYYQLLIFDRYDPDPVTGDCRGTVIWANGDGLPELECTGGEVFVAPHAPYDDGFFTRAGNVQMHPDNNGAPIFNSEVFCDNGIDDDGDGKMDCDDKSDCKNVPPCNN